MLSIRRCPVCAAGHNELPEERRQVIAEELDHGPYTAPEEADLGNEAKRERFNHAADPRNWRNIQPDEFGVT